MTTPRSERLARVGALLGIEPTRDDPRADANPAYSRAPYLGLTYGARWAGGCWVWGFGNYDGHYIDLFESGEGPAVERDWLTDIETHAARYAASTPLADRPRPGHPALHLAAAILVALETR